MSPGGTAVILGGSGRDWHSPGLVLGISGRHWNVVRVLEGTALSWGPLGQYWAALRDRDVPVKCLCVVRGHCGDTGQLWGSLGCSRGQQEALQVPGRARGGSGLARGVRGAPGSTGKSLGGPAVSPGCHRHTSVPLGTLGGAMGRRSSHAPLPGNACRPLRMQDYISRHALRRRCPAVLCGEAPMAEAAAAAPRPAPDVDSDECLREYRHLFSPDILAGQVAFITGGGSGIGFRIAEIFMRHGCRTVIASRNLQRVSEASKKLVAATGQQCLPLSLDVRQPQTIEAAVDEALKEFKRIDILINGAAGNFLCPASALSFNAFKTVIDIDTIGTFNTSKVLFEKYFRDHGGIIVNITATLSYRGQALQVHAGSAKAAIDAMTRHLAVEWGPNNIRVNSLAPGPITGTEGYRRLGGKFAEEGGQFDMIPLQRAGNKTEIAHSTLYLASPLSSYVTGTTLVVDGGSWLTSANNFPALLDFWAAGANKNQ